MDHDLNFSKLSHQLIEIFAPKVVTFQTQSSFTVSFKRGQEEQACLTMDFDLVKGSTTMCLSCGGAAVEAHGPTVIYIRKYPSP